jgi:hypothetical protein
LYFQVFDIEATLFYGSANLIPSYFAMSTSGSLLTRPIIRTIVFINFIVEPLRSFEIGKDMRWEC